jgi:hypothetical protein
MAKPTERIDCHDVGVEQFVSSMKLRKRGDSSLPPLHRRRQVGLAYSPRTNCKNCTVTATNFRVRSSTDSRRCVDKTETPVPFLRPLQSTINDAAEREATEHSILNFFAGHRTFSNSVIKKIFSGGQS